MAYTKKTLRLLARRYQALTAEIQQLDTEIKQLCAQANPALLAAPGIGPETAATLLVTAGDNPHRLTSEASFAALCGATPIQASSGQTIRHRLNRGGDRQANQALWRITMVRLRIDPRTIEYAQRRQAEGKTRREILRCLKRYIAREIYHSADQPTANTLRRPSPLPTPTHSHHPRSSRHRPPHPSNKPFTTRTRPRPQPPPRHPIPNMAHPTNLQTQFAINRSI